MILFTDKPERKAKKKYEENIEEYRQQKIRNEAAWKKAYKEIPLQDIIAFLQSQKRLHESEFTKGHTSEYLQKLSGQYKALCDLLSYIESKNRD